MRAKSVLAALALAALAVGCDESTLTEPANATSTQPLFTPGLGVAHREIKLELHSLDTPPTPHGTVRITQGDNPNCNTVAVNVANLTGFNPDFVHELYIDTDDEPMYRALNLSTSSRIQTQTMSRALCSAVPSVQELFDNWLDPAVEVRAYLVRRKMPPALDSAPPQCAFGVVPDCLQLDGTSIAQ